MTCRLPIILFLGGLLYSNGLFAQNNSVQDSLLNVLNNSDEAAEKVTVLINLSKLSQDRDQALKYALQSTSFAGSDKEKSQSYNQVAWSYKNKFNFDSAGYYADIARTHALAFGDPLTISDVYNTYGSIHNNQSGYDSAIYYYKLSLAQRVKAEDLAAQAASMNNLSLVYQRQGAYEEAADYIGQSISIYSELGLERSLADSYLNKGNLLVNAGRLDSAYVSFQRALVTYEQLQLSVMTTYALINMGTVAIELKEFEKAREGLIRSLEILNENGQNAQLMAFTLNGLGTVSEELLQLNDSSIYYYQEGARYAEAAGSKYLLSISHNNLGRLYADKGAINQALGYYESALNLKLEMGDGAGLALVYVGLGKLYAQQGKYQKAEQHFDLGLEKAQAIGDVSDLESVYTYLYEYEKSRNRHARALEYYEMALVNRDSLLNAEHLKNVSELNLKYETDKKEQQIAFQRLELAEQATRIERDRTVIIALIIISVLIVVIYLLRRRQQERLHKINEQQHQLKLREAEMNAVIYSQERERKRFAADLHDGFGQLISVLRLNLGRLTTGDKRDLELRQHVYEQSEEVISEMYTELRNICFDLMPQTLVKRGLPMALQEFGERVSNVGAKTLEVFVFDVNDRLSELIEVSLYRITQEWVNNILKYSDADMITVQLIKDEVELTLTVEDNGQGFDADLLKKSKGNGWKNIQSRLNLLNGSLELDTRIGVRGSMFTVNIPMQPDEAELRASTDMEIAV